MISSLRMATILGRARRKLKILYQGDVQDEDLIDAGNEVQDQIFQKADIERKFSIALVGDQETYPLADENTFEILNTIVSWGVTVEGSVSHPFYEFVPNSEWNVYRDASGLSYPYYLTIFGQELHVAPLPTSSWVSTDNPIIEFWGRQKKTIVPMDENTDPELPDIFDNAIALGMCKEFDKAYLAEYMEAVDDAITTYNNKKLGIQPPTPEW